MSLYPDDATLLNIQAARTLNGVPPNKHIVRFMNFGDLLDTRARETPDQVFLIHYDTDGNREELTYAQLASRVNKVANFLSVDLHVNVGDRVATIGYNHSDMVLIYFACWKLGAVVAPQNVSEDDSRIGFIL